MKPLSVCLVIVFLILLSAQPLSAQWVRMHGTDGQVVLSFALKDSTLFAGASGGIYIPGEPAHYGGAFRSTNFGLDWEPTNSGFTNGSPFLPDVWTFALNRSRIFAGTSSKGVYFSDDNGSNWFPADSGLTNENVQALLVRSGNIFAGTYGSGVFRSTDNGSSWLHADSGLTNKQVCSLASTDSNLFAGTFLGGLFISSNNGTNWSSCPGLSNLTNSCLVVGGSYLFAGSWDGVLYRSPDDGGSWTRIDSGMNWVSVYSVATRGSDLFAGTTSGSFLSTNRGTTWLKVNEGLTERRQVRSLLIADSYICAGTDTGVYRRKLSEMITSIQAHGSELLTGSVLEQNYPNPFNPSTTIRYGLPHRSHVTLAVYNTLGQQVATLVNSDLDPGFHEIQFNATNLSSGVYFYRIQAGSFVETKKLLLVR